MKFVYLSAMAAVQAVQKGVGFPEHLGEMFPNKESMYGNDWERYKKTR